MTTLNTIIEEEKKEFDNFMLEEYGKWKIGRTEAKAFLTTAMQRAYEAGREEHDTYWKEQLQKAREEAYQQGRESRQAEIDFLREEAYGETNHSEPDQPNK